MFNMEKSYSFHSVIVPVSVAWGLSLSWVGHAQFSRPATRVTVVLVLVK